MRFLVVLLASLLFAGGASALAAGTAPTVVAPSQIQWMPGTGPLKGTQVANLFGNPAKPGDFVTRIRIPNGLKLAPHSHPVLENVTVLQGTLMIGVGDKMNKAKMISLPAGLWVTSSMKARISTRPRPLARPAWAGSVGSGSDDTSKPGPSSRITKIAWQRDNDARR